MQQKTQPKPYLLRALHEWCSDNGYAPHIVVRIDARTRVPREFARNGEIVLNISFDATGQLKIGSDWIEFNARFAGKSHKIEVPVDQVLAIYAGENGEGMSFPVETQASPALDNSDDSANTATSADSPASAVPTTLGDTQRSPNNGPTGKSRRAHLKLVK